MTNPLTEMSGLQIDRLVGALDSLKDGDLAVDLLIACGARAIPSLALFLLKGSPRTISLPRSRATLVAGLSIASTRDTITLFFKAIKRRTISLRSGTPS